MEPKCEACNDTGYYGDQGPGIRGNILHKECARHLNKKLQPRYPTFRCKSCGYPVAKEGYCGKCVCEEDSEAY